MIRAVLQEKLCLVFLTRSDTKQSVQTQEDGYRLEILDLATREIILYR